MVIVHALSRIVLPNIETGDTHLFYDPEKQIATYAGVIVSKQSNNTLLYENKEVSVDLKKQTFSIVNTFYEWVINENDLKSDITAFVVSFFSNTKDGKVFIKIHSTL